MENKNKKKLINQQRLMERLKLPYSVIRYLIETDELEFEMVKGRYIFDEKSVEEFERKFNRDDYLTVGECVEKLRELDFYTTKVRGSRKFTNKLLGIYVTVKTLVDGDYVPNEYRLIMKSFGNVHVTKYILKESFYNTLSYLKNKVDEKENKSLSTKKEELVENVTNEIKDSNLLLIPPPMSTITKALKLNLRYV